LSNEGGRKKQLERTGKQKGKKGECFCFRREEDGFPPVEITTAVYGLNWGGRGGSIGFIREKKLTWSHLRRKREESVVLGREDCGEVG